MFSSKKRFNAPSWKPVFALCLLALASGCTSMRAPSASDPLEGFNRGVSNFNEVIDKAALKPLAKGYQAITAPEVRTCVNNFFSNLEDISVAFNNLLQGKPKAAGSDLCRVALNSTLGIFGLADVASELGFQKHEEDFGQTLAVWGARPGPYLVLPFLGPSTVRDTVGRVVDSPLDPLRNYEDVSERNTVFALEVAHKRAMLLTATDLIDRVALDKYAFVRDAYLARRESLIRDGVPEDNSPLELDDEDDDNPEPQVTPLGTSSMAPTLTPTNDANAIGLAFAANLKPSPRTQSLLGWTLVTK